MTDQPFEEGTIVEHPKMGALGPGRVTAISSRDVTVYFRDAGEERRFLLRKCPLVRASDQNMPGLEAKPKAKAKRKSRAGGGGKKKAAAKEPKPVKKKLKPIDQLRGVRGSWTRQQAMAKFRELFPRGFQDDAFLERAYGEPKDAVAEALEFFRSKVELDDAGHPAQSVERETLAMAAVEAARVSTLVDDAEAGALEALAADHTFAATLRALVSTESTEDAFGGLAGAFAATRMESVDPWVAVTALPAVIRPDAHVLARHEHMQLGSSLWPVTYEGGPSPTASAYRQACEVAEAIKKDISRFGARNNLHVIAFLRIMRQEEQRLRAAGAAETEASGEEGA
jgi:hypothetical protein